MHERLSLAIIIPSYNDERIIKAIRSARMFDDCSAVKVVVADGGSSPRLIADISAELGPQDVLVSEPDEGIFDGFNKGLALAEDCDFIGWIGSDDYFTGQLKSSTVLENLREADLFIADVLHVADGIVQRRTPAMPSALGLWRIGLHNPHMGTFGKSDLLRGVRFCNTAPASDVDYFINVFKRARKVTYSGTPVVCQTLGGFSNGSFRKMLRGNRDSFRIYWEHFGMFHAVIAIFGKLTFKAISRVPYYFRRVPG